MSATVTPIAPTVIDSRTQMNNNLRDNAALRLNIHTIYQSDVMKTGGVILLFVLVGRLAWKGIDYVTSSKPSRKT